MTDAADAEAGEPPPAEFRHAWCSRLADAQAHTVSRILVVQCSLHWLRPAWFAFRNEPDEELLNVSLRHPAPPLITGVVLLNLPVIGEHGRPTEALGPAFEEWRQPDGGLPQLLHGPSRNVPVVQRLIVPSGCFHEPVADLVAFRRAGRWINQKMVKDMLGLLSTPGAISPLTGYHMTWDGIMSDADPSAHL